MKAKAVKYSIQNPCDKSWNDMVPETTGRFCGSCEKTVVDFTGMSDFSIVDYLESHKTEKVCGRFTKPQLDRVYQLNQPVFAPSFDLRAVVLGLALTTFSAVHSFAQTEPREPIRIDTTINVPPIVVGTVQEVEPLIVGKVAPNYDHSKEKKASGAVITPSKNFKGISVQLKDKEGKVLKTIQPDSKGRFAFDLDWKLNPTSVEVIGDNYEPATVYFAYMRSIVDMKIEVMEQVEMIRGEVIQGDVKATED
nr:hypothetical protein [uncultured Fluviicola sp.]